MIKATPSFSAVIVQIALLDIVFSLDSVITAVGMAQHLWVMITAVVVAVIIMLFASGPISSFVNRHPTVKMLALSFLILIGFSLAIGGRDLLTLPGSVEVVEDMTMDCAWVRPDATNPIANNDHLTLG